MEHKIKVDVHEDEKIKTMLIQENIPHEVVSLPVGDYHIGSVCIERKSIVDFLGSSHGHLQEQVANMLLNTDQISQVIIALIGDYEDTFWLHMRTNENSFYGMLSSLTMKYKVSIVHFKRPRQFVKYLKYCLEKIDGSIDVTKIKRLASKDNTNLSLVCSLPNMSQLKANRLLEKYNIKLVLQSKINNDWIQNKDEKFIDNLLEIQGIGKKGAEEIAKYFY